MLETILEEGLSALSLPCSNLTLSRFRTYYNLLSERNRQMNLTAISGEEDIARLHFLDCAAILSFFDSGYTKVLDIGSGAGFPGLVLKILRPELALTLLDSQKKRVLFQAEVCEALGLPDVTCLALRAEDAPPEMRGTYDVVVSRAVARLSVLSELCIPFVSVGGRFLAMKGAAAAEELEESRRSFRLLGCEEARLLPYAVPCLNAERAVILAKKSKPTPARYPRRYAQIKKAPLS
ncbi:MAG: 16S rRNA (guanine(527)-N(7))-methyltransferase RsmG [Oscillospiraceae bacterium]|nr:16S rRNA (guanine(527)-N(7))-methyltransferase RsmG [Oscillospiraceae bacterium]